MVIVLIALPSVVHAELPLERFFLHAAGRVGIAQETIGAVASFAHSLRDDMPVDFVMHSIAPPVVEVTFASGRAVYADGTTLRLIEDTERTIEAEAVCPVLVLLSALLLWSGFMLLSLPLFVAGLEFVVFSVIICL